MLKLLVGLILSFGLMKAATAQSGAPELSVTLTKSDVAASPERIFALIGDFKQWRRWSPHEKTNPAVSRTYGGAQSGVGATYSWAGPGEIGAGRAEISEMASPSRIVVALDLARPTSGRLSLIFNIEPEGERTKVSVSSKGPQPLLDQVMPAFFLDRYLIALSCAAGGTPARWCKAMVGDRVDGD